LASPSSLALTTADPLEIAPLGLSLSLSLSISVSLLGREGKE